MGFPVPSAEIQKLKSSMPNPNTFRDVLCQIPENEFDWITRLWLSEGIPYAFRQTPALFEAMREWFGEHLDIDPKCITMIGSGRIGFSMGNDFGRKFGATSDLDLSIISDGLYGRLKGDVLRWMQDYDCKRPESKWKRRHAEENYKGFLRSLKVGFIDHYKLPFVERYPVAQLVENKLSTVGDNLRRCGDMPEFTKVSGRVYRNFGAFERQMKINLSYNKDRLEGISALPEVAVAKE